MYYSIKYDFIDTRRVLGIANGEITNYTQTVGERTWLRYMYLEDNLLWRGLRVQGD